MAAQRRKRETGESLAMNGKHGGSSCNCTEQHSRKRGTSEKEMRQPEVSEKETNNKQKVGRQCT